MTSVRELETNPYSGHGADSFMIMDEPYHAIDVEINDAPRPE